MQQLILFIFIIGIVLILMGYLELYFDTQKKEKKIEYRFIPRNIYDQIESRDLEEQMSFMNDLTDIRGNTNLV
jgi:hypothetical protein